MCDGLSINESKQVLTEISREIYVYCVHIMSATIMPISHRDGTYLEIIFMKYDQYGQRIFTGHGRNTFMFLLYGQPFPRYGSVSKLPYLGMKLGHWPKSFVSCTYASLSPKFLSVLLYGCPFPRYWQFFIILLATMLNFNLFQKKFKFEISKVLYICKLSQGIF